MSLPDPNTLAALSEASLQELTLSANNRAANLRKQIIRLMDMWNDERALASLCLWLLKHREDICIREGRESKLVTDALLPDNP